MTTQINSHRFRRWLYLICLCLLYPLSVSGQKRHLTVNDLYKIGRIENLTLSPDGDWLAFSFILPDTKSETVNADIYIVNSRGGAWQQLTTYSGYDGRPCWSPDGSLLAFLSDRSGHRQIYVLPMRGGEAQQITSVAYDILDFRWSPKGRYFAFITDVSSSESTPKIRPAEFPDDSGHNK